MRTLAPAVVLALLAGASQAQEFRHIAIRGETAPDTGGGTYWDFGIVIIDPFVDYVAPALRPDGGAAFVATVIGGSTTRGVFRDTAGTDSSVALRGQSAPGTGGGTFDEFQAPGINAAGTVAFAADVVGGTAGEGIFTASGAVVTARAVEGDPAPGTGGGAFASFAQPFGTPIASSGAVAFAASVTGGTSPSGVFVERAGTLTPVAVAGDPAPGTGGGGTFAGFGYAVGNALGDLAFAATLSGGSSSEGLFRSGPGGLAAVALLGEPAPDTGGGTYATFREYSIGAAGRVAFTASILGGAVSNGIFADQAGTDSAIAFPGDPAPGTGGGALLNGAFVSDYPEFTPSVGATRIAFASRVSGGSVDSALYLGDLPVARAGEAVPTLPGTALDEILSRLSIAGRNRLAFNATTSGSQTGPGIFAVPALPPTGLLLLASGLLAAARAPLGRLAGRC